MKLLIVVLSCLIHSIYAVHFIKPCQQHDKKCLISSSQTGLYTFLKGLPEYGVPVCDPIFLETGKSDSPGLKVNYKNINVYGLSKTKVNDMQYNDTHVSFQAQFPLKIDGLYELKGKLLILQVTGNGAVRIKTDNVGLNMVMKKSLVKGADGQDHWKISGFDYTYDLLNRVSIELDGLFNGDEEKAKPLRELITTNYKEIIEDIGQPIIRDVLSLLVKYLNGMLKKIPVQELAA